MVGWRRPEANSVGGVGLYSPSVPDPPNPIPDRAAFKAAEVCEIAQIPSYVLRSWEKEFPNLGVVPKPGGAKIYRRADVEQVLRIKQLLFSEGLTLAGARRKLEGEPPPEPEAELTLPIPEDVRTKVATVKRELQSLLDLLESGPSGAVSSGGAPSSAGPSTDAAGSGGAASAQAPGREVSATLPRPASTWPPAPPAAKREEANLPFLNGTPEEPPVPPADSEAPRPQRPRRSRRPAKG